jgi:hypothetical protein
MSVPKWVKSVLLVLFPIIYLLNLVGVSAVMGVSPNPSIHYWVVCVVYSLIILNLVASLLNGKMHNKPNTNCESIAAVTFLSINVVTEFALNSVAIAFLVMSFFAGFLHLIVAPIDTTTVIGVVIAALVTVKTMGVYEFKSSWPHSLVLVVVTAIIIKGSAGVVAWLSPATFLLLLLLAVFAGFWLIGYLERAEEMGEVEF